MEFICLSISSNVSKEGTQAGMRKQQFESLITRADFLWNCLRAFFPDVSLLLFFSLPCWLFLAILVQEGWWLMAVLNSSWQETIWTSDSLVRPSLPCCGWKGVSKVNDLLWKLLGLKWVIQVKFVLAFDKGLSHFFFSFLFNQHTKKERLNQDRGLGWYFVLLTFYCKSLGTQHWD